MARTNRPAVRTLTGAALIAGLLLTGCGNTTPTNDDDGASGSPTSPSGTSSPTSSTDADTDDYVPASADGPAQNVPVPELPAEAKEQSIEGAESTARFWWQSLDYLHMTGDSSPMLSVSSPDCRYCEGLISNWTAAIEAGYWVDVSRPTMIRISDYTIDDENTFAELSVDLHQFTTTVFDQDGTIDEDASVDGDLRAQWVAELSYDGGEWTVDQIVPIDEPNDTND